MNNENKKEIEVKAYATVDWECPKCEHLNVDEYPPNSKACTKCKQKVSIVGANF